MVSKGVPGDGDEVRGVGNVELAVVKVLVADDAVVLELVVVDPDIDGVVQGKRVLALAGDVELEVSDDDVAHTPDADTAIGESYSC